MLCTCRKEMRSDHCTGQRLQKGLQSTISSYRQCVQCCWCLMAATAVRMTRGCVQSARSSSGKANGPRVEKQRILLPDHNPLDAAAVRLGDRIHHPWV